MNIERKERGQYPMVQVAYLPQPCMHCDNAPCIKVTGMERSTSVRTAWSSSIRRRPRVARRSSTPVPTARSTGTRSPRSAEVHRLCASCHEGWTETRCTQVCPTGAIKLVLGDEAEVAALVASEGLHAYKAELGTHPRVYYKNLHRWEKVFVSGSAVFRDTDECAEGARVTVQADGATVGEGVANNYGEFMVDCLESGGTYVVTVHSPGYEAASAGVTLENSLNLGQIKLERR